MMMLNDIYQMSVVLEASQYPLSLIHLGDNLWKCQPVVGNDAATAP